MPVDACEVAIRLTANATSVAGQVGEIIKSPKQLLSVQRDVQSGFNAMTSERAFVSNHPDVELAMGHFAICGIQTQVRRIRREQRRMIVLRYLGQIHCGTSYASPDGLRSTLDIRLQS